ncbi:MAG: ammonium transporter [Richelia sp. RM2_1_2]|nr:ammonium transporter [Richelia sp. SM1_7_0]NJN07580.1 ammonium transporter [Richelia sp. RM1_1_1]NJO31558.1 ammonium transporter [Richelia sp. SL_2_1]NJO56951.1 ammonium transporter [Richelia sp. RM2_1_2]
MDNAFAQVQSPGFPPATNNGSIAFILICAALVLLMTPALAFFYGGFVRTGNVLNTLMMSFVSMAIIGVTWVLWGYSLAFSPGNAFIGGFEWLGLNDVGLQPSEYAPQIPHLAFMAYQGMFAIFAPALISGAIAERMSFTGYSVFVVLWSIFVYSPIAHMVWGIGGLLSLSGGWGALDFAGATVVHINSGVSAFVAAMYLKPRKTYPDKLSPPHNVAFILLGAGLLWFGWFGFNAGSALEANNLAVIAFVNTNTSAAAGALTWLILEKSLRGKPTAVGIATGSVTGLVGITAAAGFVTPIAAILIGSITTFICFYAVSIKHKMQVDDALDTYPIHGIGGTVGLILTGIFASRAVNPGARNGLLFGNPDELLLELAAIALTYFIAGFGTWIILKVVDVTVGLRVHENAELQGMDISEHGEEAYRG